MEQMDPAQLYTIGKKAASDFYQLAVLLQLSQSPTHRHLLVEEQRFKVWAHSLGLYQQGHASLDYRLRDAEVVKSRLADILEELQSHLENLLAIARNERLPYEEQALGRGDGETEGDNSDGTDSEKDGSHTSSESTSPSDGSSANEVEFRFKGLTEALDTLYSLAAKIRSPRNRPQRTIDELYKHVPGDIRAAYIQEREEAEIATVCYMHRQYLIENTDKAMTAHDADDIFANYSSTEHWLLRRTGVANTRRKQQFIYWKEHVIRLSQMRADSTVQKAGQIINAEEFTKSPLHLNMKAATSELTKLPIEPNSTTTATKLKMDFLKPDDLRSAMSHQTRVSTVISPGGKKLEWPDPPKVDLIGGYFICPFCKTLCPEKYLQKSAWVVHLIHDLQPYHCTYEQCQDPTRVYGSRQEWIDHESQHTRVWHCQEHSDEFETRPEYIQHLEESHPNSTPEHFSSALVAAVVGPSMQIHRDCPFCPSAFSDIAHMQSHLIFHLERLALLALHIDEKTSNNDTESGLSPQSHQVQIRGRQDSIFEDFDTREDESCFAELIVRDGEIYSSDQTLLTKETLDPVSGFFPAVDVNEWVQNLLAGELPDEQNIGQQDITPNRSPPTASFINGPSLEEYKVGWVCTGTRALVTVIAMLDERHFHLPVPSDPSYMYTLGSIGDHNIVISCPRAAEFITYSITLVAMNLHQTFPSIEYSFITGVGSGIPPNIRLGDVVIDTPPDQASIIKADIMVGNVNLGMVDRGLAASNFRFRRGPSKLPSVVLSAMQRLKVEHQQFGSNIPRYIDEAKHNTPQLSAFALRVDQLQDTLFKADYDHVRNSTTSRGTGLDGYKPDQPLENCHSCDISQVIERESRGMRVHHGLMAFAHEAVESAVIRDALNERLGGAVLCIETETEGYLSASPFLIIRGICDYADSHKNSSWVDYATAVAAAYVREILGYMSSQSDESG